MKTPNASYRVIGSLSQCLGLCRIQLVLSGQCDHLIAEASEVDEGALDLTLRELGACTVQLTDQARLVLVVRKGLSS